ncbi:PIG-L deacetylase family protein [Advenella kashmirensis]|uniref:PIG-L deacetylase family protein n=1 Tax=Advenella kashmirensis TaxID=310575 RepID=UPI0009DE676D|nr:PIG-L family deacetylase [Advenella kashmirensis]
MSYRSSTDNGFFQRSEGAPIIVVSPHYDDAVFSCGQLLCNLPLCTVMTIFTGQPENTSMQTDWDRHCGFTDAGQAMQARAAENSAALSILKVEGIDLGFLDSQYIKRPRIGSDLLADTISSNIEQIKPSSVFFPLGLFHEDHIHVSDAFLMICYRFSNVQWFVYEDIPYRNRPDRASQRISELIKRGLAIEPFHVDCIRRHKRQAVEAYKSQLRGLGYNNSQPVMQQKETYWRVHCNLELP